MKLGRALLLSALFLTFFALLDETFQHFIPGRHYDLLDYVMDVGGAMFVLVILGIRRHKNSD
jgi:VanZ family protein